MRFRSRNEKDRGDSLSETRWVVITDIVRRRNWSVETSCRVANGRFEDEREETGASVDHEWEERSENVDGSTISIRTDFLEHDCNCVETIRQSNDTVYET